VSCAPPSPLHDPRKSIGPSLWLLTLLVRFIPDSWTAEAPAFVAEGRVISDAELVSWLQVSPRTLELWRRRLKRAQLLDWTVKAGVGRVYVVSGLVNGIFAAKNKTQITSSPEPTPKTNALAPRYLQ